MNKNSFFKLIFSIVVCELAGIIGSFFTVSSVSGWYSTVVKPALNPPSWIFGPVWITLYALMGIAAFLVWQKGWRHENVRKALYVFGFQIVLNALWSIVFFGLQSPAWALLNIVSMWLVIVWTMILFYRISKPSMWLLAPYILWVSFASYLNFMIWILN